MSDRKHSDRTDIADKYARQLEWKEKHDPIARALRNRYHQELDGDCPLVDHVLSHAYGVTEARPSTMSRPSTSASSSSSRNVSRRQSNCEKDFIRRNIRAIRTPETRAMARSSQLDAHGQPVTDDRWAQYTFRSCSHATGSTPSSSRAIRAAINSRKSKENFKKSPNENGEVLESSSKQKEDLSVERSTVLHNYIMHSGHRIRPPLLAPQDNRDSQSEFDAEKSTFRHDLRLDTASAQRLSSDRFRQQKSMHDHSSSTPRTRLAKSARDQVVDGLGPFGPPEYESKILHLHSSRPTPRGFTISTQRGLARFSTENRARDREKSRQQREDERQREGMTTRIVVYATRSALEPPSATRHLGY